MERANTEAIEGVFDQWQALHRKVISELSDDAEAILQEARARYLEMIPDLAYRDRPEHLMASPLFICTGNLAVALSLKERGLDFHTYGAAYLRVLADTPSAFDELPDGEALAEMKRLADESTQNPKPGEFAMEILIGAPGTDYAMNIKSCAICHQFRKYDAMELVPYMCAADDVFSVRGDQGLRRTGTIALGAHQCDFRYKKGGEPKPLADAYPQRIRIAGE